MIGRGALALLLMVVAGAAPVTAVSSIPDPTWIGGLYDGADGNELVALVWDQSPATAPPRLDTPPLEWSSLAWVIAPSPLIVAASGSFDSRAPPQRSTFLGAC